MRELQALVAPKSPQGVLGRGRAGLVINKLSTSVGVKIGGGAHPHEVVGKVDIARVAHFHPGAHQVRSAVDLGF